MTEQQLPSSSNWRWSKQNNVERPCIANCCNEILINVVVKCQIVCETANAIVRGPELQCLLRVKEDLS